MPAPPVLSQSDADQARQFFENGEYPYPDKISTSEYEQQKAELQVELLKAQEWIKASGQKVVLLFEGREQKILAGTIHFIFH